MGDRLRADSHVAVVTSDPGALQRRAGYDNVLRMSKVY